MPTKTVTCEVRWQRRRMHVLSLVTCVLVLALIAAAPVYSVAAGTTTEKGGAASLLKNLSSSDPTVASKSGEGVGGKEGLVQGCSSGTCKGNQASQRGSAPHGNRGFVGNRSRGRRSFSCAQRSPAGQRSNDSRGCGVVTLQRGPPKGSKVFPDW